MDVKVLSNKIIGIGWDVGGWMGRKQGFSICLWDKEYNAFEWLGLPIEKSLPKTKLLSPYDIFELILNCNYDEIEINNCDMVIGIDAPLGFPNGYIDFINGNNIIKHKPIFEIKSELAYRETERHIYDVFSKKPLSAPFDKIGNNATVAISHVRAWVENYNFILQPSHTMGTNSIIEVYPALIKDNNAYFNMFNELIPQEINRKSDAFDSAICAIMAIKYLVGEELLNIAKAVSPKDIDSYIDEGWIYYLP